VSSLPSGWDLVSLNDLQADAPRAITDGPFGSNLTSAHYTDQGPRVVRLQNIGDGRFLDAKAHISAQHFNSLRAHEVLAGDLLIASLGDHPPRACLAPSALGPAIVKADCIRVRLAPSVDSRWVMHALQTPAVRRWASEKMYGVGRPRLGLKTIRAIPIPLPPLSEQRRIVEILEDHLSRLDAGVFLLTDGQRRLEAWKRVSLDGLVQQTASGTTSLGALLERLEAGRSLGGSAPPAGPGEWGIIKVSAMTWGEFRPQENKKIATEKADPRYQIRPGDVLMSRANTTKYVGAPVYVELAPERLLLSDKSLRLVPKTGIDGRWLASVLASRSTRAQVSGLATGTKDSMRNISQQSLLSLIVPQATPEQQSLVVRQARELADGAGSLRMAIDQAQFRGSALRRALLVAAFSGRLVP